MYILFIFFLTSFAGIGTMLWHKWREIKQGKVDNELHSHKEIFSIQEVIKEFEKYYHHIPWGKFFLIIEKVISRGIIFLQLLIPHLRKLEKVIFQKRVQSFFNLVEGKRERHSTDNDKSSSFLKNVLEHKEHIRRKGTPEL